MSVRRRAWRDACTGICLALTSFLLGCHDSLGVEIDELPLLGVFQPSGDLSPQPIDGVQRFRIRFELTNRTDRTLFLRTHCAIEVDRRAADGWRHVWGGRECFAALQSPIWLAPGEPFQDEIRPRSGPEWVTGDYRLRLTRLSTGLLENGLNGENIPLPLRVSSPFRVTID